MMRRTLLSVVFAASFFLTASGQDLPKMTLHECIQVALDNNLTVKRGFYNVETNKVNLLQAFGLFLPTFNVNASFARNYGRNLNPVTYQYFQGVTKTINPALTSSVTLFNGFRIQYNYISNKRAVDAAYLDLDKSKNDVIINVATYYVTVILNRELYENAKFQLSSSQQQLEKIKKQVEAGALPKSNELNQDATVATNETNLITAENNLNFAILQLKQSMQVPASTPLDVVIPDIKMEDLVIDQTPEEIYAVSSQTLPQVKSALLKVESAEYALKSTRGSYYPRISLSGAATSNYSSASDMPQYNYNQIVSYTVSQFPVGQVGSSTSIAPPSQQVYEYQPVYAETSSRYRATNQLQDNVYKNLGLNVTIPILNNFNTRTNVEQAIINRELATITVKETENTLRQSIETAYNNAVSAAKTYVASVKQVNASEEAFRMTKLRLDNGAAILAEYQIAANDLFSAKSSLSRAKYNFLLTKKIIDFYQGKSIE
jgi:outer membrane protein